MATQHDRNSSLTLTRLFDAPVEGVWQAFSDPELLSQWYGSPGKLEDVSIDFRVGGRWDSTTVIGENRIPQGGVYSLIEAPTYLKYDSLDPGEDPNGPHEVMEFRLTERDGNAELTFTQSGNLPPEEYAGGLKDGWTGFFDALQTVVEG